MRYQLQCQPSYSLLEAHLEQGESIVGDSGAMAWMSSTIKTSTTARGGLFSGLKRKMLAGESFFQNTFTAEEGPGLIGFAPGSAGDIAFLNMSNSELILEKGAYLASGPDVHCDSKWQGLKGLFNEGLFALHVSGAGPLFFHSYGKIELINVQGEYIVNNGYAVAWEPSLNFTWTASGRVMSYLYTDMLLRFSGTGKLWVQTRSPRALASWVHPFRRAKKSKN